MKYGDKLEKDEKITILSLSWRDIKSPTSGGAEVQTHQMLSKMDMDRYRIIHLAPLYENLTEEEEIDGVNYIRKGNIFTVIWFAMRYYKKNRKHIDFVIDQCNTHRFFTPFWVEHEKRIFYIHQLTREIWDIVLKPPFSTLGRLLETPLLRIYRNDYTIALSNSTKQDLLDIGFKDDMVTIIPIAMQIKPWERTQFLPKRREKVFTYVGRYALYKGIDAAVAALGILKEEYPTAKLWVLGKRDDNYIEEKLKPICKQYHLTIGNSDDADICCLGFMSEEKKLELISQSTAILFPSTREGWGIPISEGAYVGTPSIVYNSEGLRDAVDGGKAGYLCKEKNEKSLYEMMKSTIEDNETYEEKRDAAYEFTKEYLNQNIGEEFELFIKKIVEIRHGKPKMQETRIRDDIVGTNKWEKIG